MCVCVCVWREGGLCVFCFFNLYAFILLTSTFEEVSGKVWSRTVFLCCVLCVVSMLDVLLSRKFTKYIVHLYFFFL